MTSPAATNVIMSSRKVLTLALLEKGDQILLGLKKRGFGHGLWNGFGGKVEIGEDIREAAAREIKEECGLNVDPSNLEQVGLIHFLYKDNPNVHEVHLFGTSEFSGNLEESEEMAPKWWDKGGVPFDQMWPDDKIWYPLFTKKMGFRSFFYFEKNTISAYQIQSWDNDNAAILLEENWNDSMTELWSKVKLLPVMSNPHQDPITNPITDVMSTASVINAPSTLR